LEEKENFAFVAMLDEKTGLRNEHDCAIDGAKSLSGTFII
jgi:hypothetical protein